MSRHRGLAGSICQQPTQQGHLITSQQPECAGTEPWRRRPYGQTLSSVYNPEVGARYKSEPREQLTCTSVEHREGPGVP